MSYILAVVAHGVLNICIYAILVHIRPKTHQSYFVISAICFFINDIDFDLVIIFMFVHFLSTKSLLS